MSPISLGEFNFPGCRPAILASGGGVGRPSEIGRAICNESGDVANGPELPWGELMQAQD